MANLTYIELEKLLLEIFEINELTPIIKRQINRFVLEDGMSWLEIARCVSWQMDNNNGKYNAAYGIAFVPNVRAQAKRYFEELARKKEEQEKEAKNMSKWNRQKKPKLIDVNQIHWDEEGIGEDK